LAALLQAVVVVALRGYLCLTFLPEDQEDQAADQTPAYLPSRSVDLEPPHKDLMAVRRAAQPLAAVALARQEHHPY
jgi:hypothetical protein